jgi:putative SOS response-associated peptidase YedK
MNDRVHYSRQQVKIYTGRGNGMCYYSSISVGFRIIETRFGVEFVQRESYQPVYSASAFTYPRMPVITGEEPDRLSMLAWGLIPFWVKDETSARELRKRTVNARAETIFEKPAFRHSIMNKRCLVVVDGFFEWRHENRQSYPYYIRLKDGQPFALAGIWDRWQEPGTEKEIKTFAVITTSANPLMAQIHNTRKRMPVILSRADEQRWLRKDLGREEIKSMLKPYEEREMQAHPVGRSVVKLGLNKTDQSVLEKKEYPGLMPLLV